MTKPKVYHFGYPVQKMFATFSWKAHRVAFSFWALFFGRLIQYDVDRWLSAYQGNDLYRSEPMPMLTLVPDNPGQCAYQEVYELPEIQVH